MANVIDELNREQLRTDVPQFGPGDTLRVQVKVTEGTRERLQAFEGVCTVSYTHLTLPTT